MWGSEFRIPNMYIKSQVSRVCNPSSGSGRDKRFPPACWPNCLAALASSKPAMGPILKIRRKSCWAGYLILTSDPRTCVHKHDHMSILKWSGSWITCWTSKWDWGWERCEQFILCHFSLALLEIGYIYVYDMCMLAYTHHNTQRERWRQRERETRQRWLHRFRKERIEAATPQPRNYL